MKPLQKEKPLVRGQGLFKNQTIHSNNPTIATNEDQILPHNNEAEIQTLTAIFCGVRNGDLSPIERARKLISPEDFYHQTGTAIFQRCLEFYDAGRAFNAEEVETSFEGATIYENIVSFLDRMRPITTEVISHYSMIVRDTSVRRQFITLTYEASRRGYCRDVHITQVMIDLMESLETLRKRGAA